MSETRAPACPICLAASVSADPASEICSLGTLSPLPPSWRIRGHRATFPSHMLRESCRPQDQLALSMLSLLGALGCVVQISAPRLLFELWNSIPLFSHVGKNRAHPRGIPPGKISIGVFIAADDGRGVKRNYDNRLQALICQSR